MLAARLGVLRPARNVCRLTPDQTSPAALVALFSGQSENGLAMLPWSKERWPYLPGSNEDVGELPLLWQQAMERRPRFRSPSYSRGPVAQVVEHLTFNQRVAGSSPARLTNFRHS